MAASPGFLMALHTECEALSAQYPDLAPRLAKAATAIENGRVIVDETGHSAMVQSKSDPAVWYPVNGQCPCPASQHRNEACYHRLALRLYQKVIDRLAAAHERETTDVTPVPTLKPQWLVSVQGKAFVRFEGLLELAHATGLVELSTTVVSVSEVLCVCQCVARFQDGRTFTDIGDASEANVAPHLRKHFIRMAGTRAAARALRRALNISACSVEELSGDETV